MKTFEEVAKEPDPFLAVFGVPAFEVGRPAEDSPVGRLLGVYPRPREASKVSRMELHKARKRAERNVLLILRAVSNEAFMEIYEKELIKELTRGEGY